MQEILIQKLHDHVRKHYPDFLIQLQEEQRVTPWLAEQVQAVELLIATLQKDGLPSYIIEERCMRELLLPLGMSRFDHVSEILEEEFEDAYYRMQGAGVLTYEVLNILAACDEVFEAYPLSAETEDSRLRHYAVTGVIKEYFDQRTSV